MKSFRGRFSSATSNGCGSLDRKLAAYLAATATGTLLAHEAGAVIVSNQTVQPFGINGAVPIDFNSDGQIDFEIDHDRVDIGGGNLLDYLQLDKNDQSGASTGEDPLVVPNWEIGFPTGATVENDTAESAYVVENTAGAQVNYPSALLAGQEIGAGVSVFDFQEGNNVHSSMQIARANRLIDEDHNQVDTVLGGQTAFYPLSNTPQFVGLNGDVRYLGVKMDLNDANAINYGWIGLRITNEADATGEVVGWGYETEPGVSILAGAMAPGLPGDYNGNGEVDAADYVIWRKNNGLMGGATAEQGDGTGDGNVTVDDYNFWRTNFGNGAGAGTLVGTNAPLQAVPEPSSLLVSALGAIAIVGAFFVRRFRKSAKNIV
jgi:PEP-CTERM motif-containing protein